MLIKIGTKHFFLVKALMKLNYPLNSSADLEISNKDPPLNEDSMIGNNADSNVSSTIYFGGSNILWSKNFSNIFKNSKIWLESSLRDYYWPVTSHFWLVELSFPYPIPFFFTTFNL